MSTDGDFRRIGIVGIGLIGGSLAFAVRRVFPDAAVIGIDRDDVTLVARQLGALTVGSGDLAALAEADLIVLAAPITQNIAVLSRLGDIVRGPALVTDVGSTKRTTVEASHGLPPALDLHRRAPAGRLGARRPGSLARGPVRAPPVAAHAGRGHARRGAWIGWPSSSARWARHRSWSIL